MSASATAPLILTPKDEAILRFLAQTGAGTAKQITHALFSPGSLTTVRNRMSALAGGADFQPRSPLVRFPVPSANGNPVRAFAIGSKGRELLAHELGQPVSSYRPYKLGLLSASFLRHELLCTSCVVAVMMFVRRHPEMALRECLLDHDLTRIRSLKVIPDLWIRVADRGAQHAIFLEVDNSTQYRKAFTKRLAARIHWVRSGEFKTLGVPGLQACYLVAGDTAEAAEARRHTLSKWTVETIQALGLKESWAGLFRFTSVGTIDEVYEQGIFERAKWYKPSAPDTPLTLFSA